MNFRGQVSLKYFFQVKYSLIKFSRTFSVR